MGAVLASWTIPVRMLLGLLALAFLYARGWRLLHREMPARYPVWRLAAFLSGLLALFIAVASPLDAFGAFLLQVHMIQHLLLMMAAPALLWMGQPVLPVVRALPAWLVRDAFGPFLLWKPAGRALTHPVVGWVAMTAATVGWHFAGPYQFALRSPFWHEVEHACFFSAGLLFWWPVVGVWPSHPQWPRWAMLPYLLTADFVNTALSAWLTFSSHVLYPIYESVPRLWGISALDDQGAAGALMWVPGSVAYLVPAFLIAMEALGARRPAMPPPKPANPFPILQPPPAQAWRPPVPKHFRVVLQGVMLVLAALLVADGFLGPQVSPLNLAGGLPWTYWRGFAVIALLVAGNLFCMACPFTLPRDLARRFLPAGRKWPRQLRSKWLAVSLLLVYLAAYERFSLWDSPWLTAWIVVAYFTTALLVDGFFEGASFCKYVCPIGQFHFVNSLVSPLEIRVRDAGVCRSCETHDCLNGNASQRGCEMLLFQPTKSGNFDCTFCLDCVHACPQGNVGLAVIAPGKQLFDEKLWRRTDVAALALAVSLAAFVSAAAMVTPVENLTWFALILVPVLWGRALWKQFALALVPLGFSMWVAHFAYHLQTGFGGLPAVVERWMPQLGVASGHPMVADWMTPLQLLLLDGGLLLSLYAGWKISGRTALRALPWGLLMVGLWMAGVWTFFQPMQMRGMVMR